MLRSGCAALRNCGGKVAGRANGWDTTTGKRAIRPFFCACCGLTNSAPHNLPLIIRKCIKSIGAFAYNNGYAHKKGRRERAGSRQGLRVAPQGGATRVPARTGISRRRGVCARLLLPAQYAAGRILAEKLFTAAVAGRASTLG